MLVVNVRVMRVFVRQHFMAMPVAVCQCRVDVTMFVPLALNSSATARRGADRIDIFKCTISMHTEATFHHSHMTFTSPNLHESS